MAKVGIQLYTVRDHFDKDYIGAIKKMKDFGYDGVEFPGNTMNMISAADLKATLAGSGLLLAGITFDHSEFESSLDKIIAYCKECGCSTVVYPWIPEENRPDRDGYLAMAGLMNEWGKKLKQNGIAFLYHIHGYEFKLFDGKTGFEILMEHINTEYMKLEIDVYWVEAGGVDCVPFVEKYAGLSPSIHFKDCVDRVSMTDTEVGEGCLDMAKIAEYGVRNNAQWFIVEQEQFVMPTFKSAEISAKNLTAINENAIKAAN